MEEILKQILGEIGSLKSEIGSMKSDIGSIKENMATKDDIRRLETKIDIIAENQQQDVVATLQLMDDKMATKDDIDRVAHAVNYLVRKSAEHDDDIRKLLKIWTCLEANTLQMSSNIIDKNYFRK